jgi:hypothetical protein
MTETMQEAVARAILRCQSGRPYTRSFKKLVIETARRGWIPVVKLTITDPKDDVLADEVVTFCRALPAIQQPVNEDYEAGARTITLLVA